MEPLTAEEAIFGGRGVPPLDLSKSSGMGGLKSAWVNAETKTLNDDFAAMVAKRVASLESGEWELPVVTSALKNELRKVDKAMDGETRHFNPYPFDALVV